MSAKRSVRTGQRVKPSDRAAVCASSQGEVPSNRRGWWCFWGAFAVAAAALESLSGGAPDTDLHLAYLDPGAGSFVIQALVAMLAGIAVTLKVYWHRIRGFFGFANPDEDDDENADLYDD